MVQTFNDLSQTKWWKVNCMVMDIDDYLNGDMDKDKFKEYMAYDLEWIKRLVDEE